MSLNNALKYFLVTVAIVFCQLNLAGQDEAIDSLKFALKNAKHDTTKCSILRVLCDISQPEETINYGEQLKLLAQKNSSADGELKIIYMKHLAYAYKKIGVAFYYRSYFPQALENCFKSLKLSEDLGDKQQAGRTLSNIANIYNIQGDFIKALSYYFRGLKLSEEAGDKQMAGRTLNGIAHAYNNQANYPKALEYYFRGLKLSEETGDKGTIGGILGNIATVYQNQNDYPKALEYYFKGLKIGEEVGDKQTIGGTLNNIGSIYRMQYNYPKALEYSFKGLKLSEEVGDTKQVGETLGNIATVYSEQKDYPKALEYSLKGLKLSEEVGDNQMIAKALGNIGGLYLNAGKYKESEVYLKKGLLISKEIGAEDLEKVQHEYLYVLYDGTKRPLLALEEYKKFIALRDTIFSQENTKKLMRLEMNRDYEKKTQDLKYQQEKKDIQANEERQKQKILTYSVTVGLVLVLLLALFVFRGYRQKRNDNLIITRQKHEVEESRKEIIDSIHYAKRIQRAMITSDKYIEKNLNRLQI